jgi:hypothetical protein
MREIIVTIDFLHIEAFDATLKAALPGKVLGVSAPIGVNGQVLSRSNPDGSGNTTLLLGQVRVHLDDAATPTDEITIAGLAQAHDPVYLSTDKTVIVAVNPPTDSATVTVRAPKAGAAPVTLLVAGSAVPVTLTGGVGTLAISSADPASIAIGVQTPGNRSTDQLVIQAG